MLTQDRLERVERLAGPAAAGEHRGQFTRVVLVGSEARPVNLQALQGGAVVPTPPFRPGQLNPDGSRVGLHSQVPAIGLDRLVRPSAPGADARELQCRLVMLRLE